MNKLNLTPDILQNMILNSMPNANPSPNLNEPNPNPNPNPIFNPTTLDPKYKKMLVNQTISNTKIGLYQSLPKPKTIGFQYQPNYNPSSINNICMVNVVYEHSLDLVERYADIGTDLTQTNGLNPAIMNVVGSDFNGTSFDNDIRDDMINLRTTFNNSVGSSNPYPMKETECVHSRMIYEIRDPYKGFLPWDKITRFSLITVSPIKQPTLLNESQMYSEYYIKTCAKIETFFQTAIAGNNSILILTPFGDKQDGNPQDDIIKIYNYCIFKYGHKFKEILIAIPKYYPVLVFDKYNNNIIRLNNIVEHVDMAHDKLEMERNLKNRFTN